jgi:hypothetical protein
MKTLLLGAALVLLASLGALAAEPTPKRNIFGFHPGMFYTEAMSVVADVCKGDKDMSGLELPSFGFSSIVIHCSAGMREDFFATNPNLKQQGEDALVLTFAADLPEQPLSSVGYRFDSGAPDHDLIQAVADQFAILPVCRKTGDNSECFSDWLPSMRVTRLEPQGWSLSFNRELGTPVGVLILSDVQIMEAENTAGRERAKWNKFAPTLGAKP